MLVGWIFKRHHLRVLVAIMAMHIATVLIVLAVGTPYESADEQWRYFERVARVQGFALWGGLGLYAGGVLVTCIALIRKVSGPSNDRV
jgi:hypothetical protein